MSQFENREQDNSGNRPLDIDSEDPSLQSGHKQAPEGEPSKIQTSVAEDRENIKPDNNDGSSPVVPPQTGGTILKHSVSLQPIGSSKRQSRFSLDSLLQQQQERRNLERLQRRLQQKQQQEQQQQQQQQQGYIHHYAHSQPPYYLVERGGMAGAAGAAHSQVPHPSPPTVHAARYPHPYYAWYDQRGIPYPAGPFSTTTPHSGGDLSAANHSTSGKSAQRLEDGSSPKKRTRTLNQTNGGTSGNVCSNCGTTDTPMWRRGGEDGKLLLCNKCGLFWARHNRLRPLKVLRRRKRSEPSESTTDHGSGSGSGESGGSSTSTGSIGSETFPPHPAIAHHLPRAMPMPLLRPFVPGCNVGVHYPPFQPRYPPVQIPVHHPSARTPYSRHSMPGIRIPFSSDILQQQQQQQQGYGKRSSSIGEDSNPSIEMDNDEVEQQATDSLLALHQMHDKPDISPPDQEQSERNSSRTAAFTNKDGRSSNELPAEMHEGNLPARFRFKKKKKKMQSASGTAH